MIKRSAVLTLTLVLLLSVTLVAQAQTISNMGYTLNAPDDQSTCPPTGSVSTTGIEADRHIKVWFFSHDPVTNITTILQSFDRYNSGDFSMAFPYPAISADTDFEVRIDFYDAFGNLIATKLQAWWKVTCTPPPPPPPPPPPGGEGCTPGFWRNHTEIWPAPYDTGDYFNTVFTVNFFSPTYTLGQAIWAGGGGLNVLARHGTAALLSAASADVDYPYTVAQVIAMVQAGNVAPLSAANELGCPLN